MEPDKKSEIEPLNLQVHYPATQDAPRPILRGFYKYYAYFLAGGLFLGVAALVGDFIALLDSSVWYIAATVVLGGIVAEIIKVITSKRPPMQ